ncbi:MAG TPA: hypothetical protein VND64_25400 [Pirellulales bacterium]|nr:hypothetical protein [Pirellulales bacterium]
MDHYQKNRVKPRTSWLRFWLKALLPPLVIGGLSLALYRYWDDWRKQRPPFIEYDVAPYRVAFMTFVNDLKRENLGRAYDSTSAQFKRHMSRSELEILIYTYPRLAEIELFEDGGFIGADLNRTADDCEIKSINDRDAGLRNWMTDIVRIRERDGRGIEVWVWVVMDDSFFHRRPPAPRVEEIQVREISKAQWQSESLPGLLPRWERE